MDGDDKNNKWNILYLIYKEIIHKRLRNWEFMFLVVEILTFKVNIQQNLNIYFINSKNTL